MPLLFLTVIRVLREKENVEKSYEATVWDVIF